MDAYEQALENLLTASRVAVEAVRYEYGWENDPNKPPPEWLTELELAIAGMESEQ